MKRRKNKRYSREFKAEAVRLVLTGEVSVEQAGKDLGVAYSTLHSWVAAAQRHKKKKVVELPTEVSLEAEVRRLRKENEILKMEREILKKATAFFAKENE
jgi:transposase